MPKILPKIPELTYIKGVGPYLAKCFENLEIFSVETLLQTPPKGYEDHKNLPKIASLKLDEITLFKGQIRSIAERFPKPKLSLLSIVVQDVSGSITIQAFNQAFLKKSLVIGRWVVVRGKLNAYQGKKHVTVHQIEQMDKSDKFSAYPHQCIPIYNLTKGLKQSRYRQIIQAAWTMAKGKLVDPLPDDIRKKCHLMKRESALHALHFPEKIKEAESARTRLAFDDFFYHQLALAHRKMQATRHIFAPKLQFEGPLVQKYYQQLPYTLTKAQQSAIGDIADDIQKDRPMNRLVQGDVGAGKTEVAVISLLSAIQSGKCACFIAPTQVLAEQHYFKLVNNLSPIGVDVILLKGKMRKKEKTSALERIQDPTPCIIVGTHAVIQPHISLTNLGLVIMDEQHRFGVLQRMALNQGDLHPHALFLSATPIPRSLVLTVYGDLEKTLISELPPGRKPINTVYQKPYRLEKVYEFCREKIQSGQQVYMVFPLVEESEKIDLKAAIAAFEDLQNTTFKSYQIGLMHGKMVPKDKTSVMSAFKSGEIQVLVATTVIEVGVDVPNATVMVIHHAERFGLSQLHQLRGRVGRGQEDSTCFLIGNPKTESGKARIQAMVETQDGFQIAEKDLEIRGPGDFMGTRQSGLPNFPVGDILVDQDILNLARKVAFHIIKSDPTLQHPSLLAMKETLQGNYGHLLEGRLN